MSSDKVPGGTGLGFEIVGYFAGAVEYFVGAVEYFVGAVDYLFVEP